MKRLITILGLISLLLVSCEDRSTIGEPEAVNTGAADFSRFVTVGNSLTAGYQNGAIYQTAQNYSFGNQINRQLYNGADFEQPLFSDPGTGNRMELESLEGPIIIYNTQTGVPLNSNATSYNNLGVSGALVYDIVHATNKDNCFQAINGGGSNPMFDLVLRGLGSQFSQIKAQNPTFLTLWIGNNDILGHATSGGTMPFTPTFIFKNYYTELIDSLASLNCDVLVANIPSVKSIPFFTTIGPKTGLAIKDAYDGGLIHGIFYQNNNNSVNLTPLTPDDLFNLNALITLKGGAYAPLLGTATGKFYRDNNLPLPAGVDTTKVFGFDPANPWPNALILDKDEILNIDNITAAYNNVISDNVSSNGFHLLNFNAIFSTVALNGYTLNGETLTTEYIKGGLFGLDGVHPTSKGYAFIANEFIELINSDFNAKIPLVNISLIPGSIPLTQ